MSDNSFQGAPAGASEAAEAVPGQENANAPEPANTEDSHSQEGGEPSEPKTYTQDDLNRIIAKEKAKVERSLRREMEQAAQQPQQEADLGPEPDPKEFTNPLDYAKAYGKWLADQTVAEREAIQHQTKVQQTYATREEAVRDKYDDFQEVAYNKHLPISEAMKEAILESEVGPEVLYHLGKNPGEARRIAGLSPASQIREIGKLEATLTANPPAKKVTNAPDPITPVRRGSGTPSYDPTDPRSLKMDPDAWIKARNEQVMKRSS